MSATVYESVTQKKKDKWYRTTVYYYTVVATPSFVCLFVARFGRPSPGTRHPARSRRAREEGNVMVLHFYVTHFTEATKVTASMPTGHCLGALELLQWKI